MTDHSCAPATAAPRPPRWHRVLWSVAALVAVALVALVALTQWLWRTTAGLHAVVQVLDRALPVRIEATSLHGSFAHGFGAARLRVDAAGTRVELTGFEAVIDGFGVGASAGELRLVFAQLSAERLQILLPPTGPPEPPPASIAVPLQLAAARLAVGVFELRRHGEDAGVLFAMRDLAASIAATPAGYQIRGARARLGADDLPLQAALDGTLGGTHPFALDARGELGTRWHDQPVRAHVVATGSLRELRADLQLAGGQAHGSAEATLDAFGAPALRRLRINLHDLDPAAWVSAAPSARLTVQADLVPQPIADGPLTVAGPVRIDNARAGLIDRGRLPLTSLRAQVRLNARALEATEAVLELPRGRASGRFALEFGRAFGWNGDLVLTGVDPAAVHGSLRPVLLDGRAAAAFDGSTTRVTADVRNRRGPPLRLNVDLALQRQRAVLHFAQAVLGPGVAVARGEIDLSGRRALRLAGTVAEFDPSLLIAGIDARVTGSFLVDGALHPRPAGFASFALSDSRAWGRPLAGRGVLTLADDQQLDADVTLQVRSATLSARGGLGAPQRALDVALDLPRLDELGAPVTGSVTLRARLTGDWTAPAAEVELEATQLQAGDHALAALQAIARYGGGRDGALALRATASGHRFRANPLLSVRSATLTVDGNAAAHRATLTAFNEESQPLQAALSGAADPARRLWRGELRELRAGAPFDLELLAPVAVAYGEARWSLGPAALRIAGARVDDVQLEIDSGRLVTRGRFADLRPGQWRGLADTALIRHAERAPLTLRGAWALQVGNRVDGSLRIERSGGDLYAGATPMGVDAAEVDVAVRANRLLVNGRLRATRAGRIDLQAQAELAYDEGWRLAQDRPLSARAEIDLQSIGWANALLGEAVHANVRLGGRLAGSIQVTGTPADPVAEGRLHGDGLRAAWIEQGVRLEGGTLAARLEGSQIVLESLRFGATTLLPPADRRTREAAEAARGAASEPGYLLVNGRLQLRDLSGVLQVRAVQMPFLQRADRWLAASGGANIVFDRRLVQLNGAVVANAGFVDFSRPDLPTLSSDVQVVRVGKPRAAREAPIGFAIDLGIDLGPAFRLRGSGLDTRIDGALRLRGDGRGPVRTAGAVEAKDGSYQGFGQNLVIERGRVNFQGAIENAGLDILAVRRDLPVVVGVAISRTASDPLVKLYSEEPMSDLQILSWLVLGRPPEEGAADRLAMARAAASLLAGSGEGVPTQLARRLGIDEFSLRSGEAGTTTSLLPRASVAGSVRAQPGETVAGEIVTIGKRLSDRVTVTFEQAIGGASNALQVSYQLSRRLSLLARAGTDNALDLVYTFAFD